MPITDPNIMIEMIQNGEGVEHYEEWLHYKTSQILEISL